MRSPGQCAIAQASAQAMAYKAPQAQRYPMQAKQRLNVSLGFVGSMGIRQVVTCAALTADGRAPVRRQRDTGRDVLFARMQAAKNDDRLTTRDSKTTR
jgi:hypothetical protein